MLQNWKLQNCSVILILDRQRLCRCKWWRNQIKFVIIVQVSEQRGKLIHLQNHQRLRRAIKNKVFVFKFGGLHERNNPGKTQTDIQWMIDKDFDYKHLQTYKYFL